MTVDPRPLDRALRRDDRTAVTCRSRPLVDSESTTVRRSERIAVADVMATSPHVSEPNAPVPEILHRILTLGQHEIVVIIGDRPQGVITARHLATLLTPAPCGWRPRHAADLLPPRNSRLLPDLDLSTAAAVMASDGVDALPVVDHRGALLGVVAYRDLISHLARGTP
jgi:CBS domain-containing protein